uniref:Protein kinase domain-containing protein n=1 Tax=Cucumis sativus TaxID=3659 RepID=A0A0A0KVY1_CUCSA
MIYRINIGGGFISPTEDTGMFRTWFNEENSFLKPSSANYDAQPANSSIHLNYSSKVPAYIAPENVYRTARTMGPNNTENKIYNLTWEYPVAPGFFYMIRLHFCEFQEEINSRGDRVFLIYIRDNRVESSADVFGWAGGKGIPYYRDCVIFLPLNDQKKVNLSVTLQANPDDSRSRFTNVILNGIEIFKLNYSNGNFGGQNPDTPPTTHTQILPPSKNNSPSRIEIIVIIVVVGGAVVTIFAVGLFVFWRRMFVFWRRIAFMDQISSHGTSLWPLYSISTNKSSKSRTSSLPSSLCRYFSLVDIKAATKNFDENFIIGIGGFGNVYKGYIDDGATQVAIKRLKPDERWVAKVSDFGLSKVWLTNMSKAHISTVVKGSFGYLDPEYCRHQQLTEKSDVYSFGVVLCEMLCARRALVSGKDEITALLAELVRQCYREKRIDEIIDSKIKDEIAPECLKRFMKLVVSCIESEGNKRPSMNDIEEGLEFVLKLQEEGRNGGDEHNGINNEEGWILRDEALSDSSSEMMTSSNQNSCFVYHQGTSGLVFSELEDLPGR